MLKFGEHVQSLENDPLSNFVEGERDRRMFPWTREIVQFIMALVILPKYAIKFFGRILGVLSPMSSRPDLLRCDVVRNLVGRGMGKSEVYGIVNDAAFLEMRRW